MKSLKKISMAGPEKSAVCPSPSHKRIATRSRLPPYTESKDIMFVNFEVAGLPASFLLTPILIDSIIHYYHSKIG
jgi:hypothetical protein